MLLIDDEKAEDFLFFILCVSFACVCLFAICMPGTRERQKSQIPLQGVTGGCEQLCGCWEPNPDILEEQQNAFNF